MKPLKILLAIILIALSLAPMAMFIPLFFKSTLGWVIFVNKLPEYAYYVIGLSVVISQVYLLISGTKLMKRKRYLN